MSLLGNVTGQEISVIKDPFTKKCTGNIWINYNTDFTHPYWKARVEFRNGNTRGEQSTPQCGTFEEVIIALKQILNEIEGKD